MIFEKIKQNLEKKEIESLLKYEKINYAELEVDGKKYPAWRIIHNTALGPGKGGIRFHPDVSEGEIKSLSFWMSLKTSLMGLPFGGAKGGVKLNPKELSEGELEEISRRYIQTFYKDLGENKDIPAPDVYTNSKIMAWMLDEYEKITKRKEPAMITGKPVELGGLALREDSTSRGGFIILKEFLKKIENTDNIVNFKKDKLGQANQDSKQARKDDRLNVNNKIKIAIQGFGNAGMNIAKMLDKEGFKIIAVSDSKGGVVDEGELEIEKIVSLKTEGKSVHDYSRGKGISNNELLELNADILILAALENQITKENVENIKARYILELANGPVSSEADEILWRKKIIVIPDILANAGGVVASYFEWMLNKENKREDEEELKKKFKEIMISSFEKVWKLYEENKDQLSMREAAYIISIRRILDAERRRENL